MLWIWFTAFLFADRLAIPDFVVHRDFMKPLPFGWLCSIACMLCVTGCGSSGPTLGTVTGTVTLDGKPVSQALVTFISKEPDGTSSFGMTDANGKYRLEFTTERMGAMLGDHDVEIVTKQVSKSEEPDTGVVEKTEFVPIPKHYSRGALTAKVEAGSNVCDFALTTKKPN